MAELSLKNIGVVLADNQVLNDISFQIDSGEIVCLLGQSGSGKSTLLRAIAGLQAIEQGEMYLNGERIAGKNHQKSSKSSDIGMIFQDYALFPHLSVSDNIGFGLLSISKSEKAKRIAQVIEMMDLQGLENRKPSELSGGQQQRVSIARSLVCEPKVLLFDEPFSNLDKQVKQDIISSIKALLKAQNMTSIFVTHDRDEAFLLADKIAIIEQGEVAQFDTPENLYQKPATAWVANSLGFCTMVDAEKKADIWQTPFGNISDQQLAMLNHWRSNEGMKIALRAREYQLLPDEQGSARIIDKTFLGHSNSYQVCIHDKLFNMQSESNFEIGQPLTILLNFL